MSEKSILEQALLQVQTLEEAVKQNAKGILASTMKQELNDLLKESLEEEEEVEPTEEEKETDVEEETSYQFSNSSAYNALTLGTGMLREEISPFKQKVKHSDGHTYVGKDSRPRLFAIRNNAAKEAHRQNGEVVRVEKGYMVKLKESTDAKTNQEFLQETNTTSGRETSIGHSEISGTITCAPGSGTVTITEHCGNSSAHK
jgi:hypothetical protein